MENSDDKYLYKVFERPETLGEQNQAERLKRFSKDPNDILKTREKLEKLKEDLQEKYENQENIIRRYNRGKLFVITPPSFLEQIFLYSKVKEKFKQKYGKRRKIKSSFFNLLLRQSLFFPGDEVIKYLEREGMQIIGFLKPVMKILYEAGWLDVKGKTILSPEEFNLIHRAKNIVEDENIEDFFRHYKRPIDVIEKLKRFLSNFFLITLEEGYTTKLIEAIYKSIEKILTDEELKNQKREIIGYIEMLFGGDFEENVIFPTIESAYLRPFSKKELKKFIVLPPMDLNYEADPKLSSTMEARKKRYKKELKDKIEAIKEEIEFINDLKSSLSYKLTLPSDKKADILQAIIHIIYEGDKATIIKVQKNIVSYILSLIQAFNLIYSFILEGNVKIRALNGEIKEVFIFDETLFQQELETIRKYQANISTFSKKGYNMNILKKEELNDEERVFINILNHINDAFFFIGEKLYKAIKGHTSQKKVLPQTGDFHIEPLSEKTLGKAMIPFFDNQLVHMATGGMGIKYSLNNKKIYEILEEIKAFSFSFAYKFEYQYRNFSSHVRFESLRDKIEKINNLMEEKAKLEKEFQQE
jgi:hypothetical protein